MICSSELAISISMRLPRKLLPLFALLLVCTFISMIFRGSLQTPEWMVQRNSEVDSRLELDWPWPEKVLLDQRKELEALNRNIETKLISHPRAKILQPKEEEKGKPKALWAEPMPVLVIVCDRPEAVKGLLRQLIKYRRSREQFPIIVSQDCDNRAVREAVNEFGTEVEYIKHICSETSRLTVPPGLKRFEAYYKIARHYRLALDHVFLKLNHTSVIVVEDDLDIAPDFFEYFLATRPLLEVDSSLLCVSAWNDNGKPGLIDSKATALLYRTDFFPGLGWMMTRGLFFDRHIRLVLLNQAPVEFTKMSLDHLLKERYDRKFLEHVYSLPRVTVEELLGKNGTGKSEFRIGYDSMKQFVRVAQRLGLMADSKSGVPRTAYLGVVSCFFNGKRLFIAPGGGAHALKGL